MSCDHSGITEISVCHSCGLVVKPSPPKKEIKRVKDKAPEVPFEPISFFAPGVPVTQGSMMIRNGKIVHNKTKELLFWRKAVSDAAKTVLKRQAAKHEALEIDVTFFLPRPASTSRPLPSVKPDLDKLLRAVGDALDKTVYVEDSQITAWSGRKLYDDEKEPGAFITVRPAEMVQNVGLVVPNT